MHDRLTDSKRGLEMLEAFQQRLGKAYCLILAEIGTDASLLHIAKHELKTNTARQAVNDLLASLVKDEWNKINRMPNAPSFEQFQRDLADLFLITKTIAGVPINAS